MTDPDPYDADRGSGMFTQRDRELLMGEFDPSEYEDPADAVRQARYRLRNRLKNGLLDFTLVVEGLASEDIDLALGDVFEPESADTWEDAPFLAAMRDAMYTFTYSVGSPELIEEMILSAVWQGLSDRYYADEIWRDVVIYPFLFASHSKPLTVSQLEALRERGLLRDFCEDVVSSRPPSPNNSDDTEQQVQQMIEAVNRRIEYGSSPE